MKKILIINEAGDGYPSGIIRASIYRECFENSGYHVTYKSFQNPAIVKLANSDSFFAKVLRGMRFIQLLQALNTFLIKRANVLMIPYLTRKFDIIYLQKVLSWSLIQKISKMSRARLVYDLNDGLWLPIWQKQVRGEIGNILSTVDAVTCDNPFGVEYAKKFNQNSYLIPDSPQVELFDKRRDAVDGNSKIITLGWIGTPGTLFNLYSIFEPLEQIFGKYDNIHLRLLGAGYNRDLLPCFEKVKFSVKPFYNQRELVDEVLKMDIGLFPLFNIDNSNARGVLKATIYMSGEAAVIGSAVGQSIDLIEDGVNGMLAGTSSEWVEKLSTLIENVNLRKKIAKKALETIKNGYTINKNFEKLISALDKA